MNKKLVINRSLIADGLLFITPGMSIRYLGKGSWEKPRWLSENAGNYRRLADGEQQSAELYSSIENDKNGAPQLGRTARHLPLTFGKGMIIMITTSVRSLLRLKTAHIRAGRHRYRYPGTKTSRAGQHRPSCYRAPRPPR